MHTAAGTDIAVERLLCITTHMYEMYVYICYVCIHVMYLYIYMHTAGGTHTSVEKLWCISMHIYEIYLYICDACIHAKCIYTCIMYLFMIFNYTYLCILRVVLT